MKKSSSVIILGIVLLLVFGCAGSPTKTTAKSEPKEYSGFMDLKAGMWTETVSKSGGQKITTRTELIENSPSLAKFQVFVQGESIDSVSQVWTNPKKGTVLKYIVKSGNDVLCYDASKVPSGSVPSSGNEYPPAKADVSKASYTTPTGKTVTAARFATKSGEAWVSSEVPFGLVKVMVDDKTVSSLYDFGTIGAKSRISNDDIDTCTDMTNLVSTSEVTYTAEEEDDEEELDYEEYREDSATEYKTNVKEAGTGKTVSVGCEACDGMPEAAKNACLAACG
jgi:outer membrane lipoprotein-sorting protein